MVLTLQLERTLLRFVTRGALFLVLPSGCRDSVLERLKSPAAESLIYKNASWTSGLVIHNMQRL